MSQDAFWVFLGILVSQLPAIIIAMKTKNITASTNAMAADTQGRIGQLEHNTNSNTEKLMESVRALANKTGHEEGRAQGLVEGASERRSDQTDQRLVTLVTPVTLTTPAESVKSVSPLEKK